MLAKLPYFLANPNIVVLLIITKHLQLLPNNWVYSWLQCDARKQGNCWAAEEYRGWDLCLSDAKGLTGCWTVDEQRVGEEEAAWKLQNGRAGRFGGSREWNVRRGLMYFPCC